MKKIKYHTGQFVIVPLTGAIGFSSHATIVDSFKQSQYYLNYQNLLKDQKLGISILKEQTPWSIETQYSSTKNIIANENLSGQDTSLSHQLEANLNYQRRDSLSLRLTSSYTQSQFEDPTSYPENDSSTYSITLNASYSLNMNGQDTIENIQRAAQKEENKISYIQSIESLNQELIKFQSDITDYSISLCKRNAINQISHIIKKAVDKGVKLFQTNQISRQDLLNFENLHNQYRSKIQQYENQVNIIENDLLFYNKSDVIKKSSQDVLSLCSKVNEYQEILDRYLANANELKKTIIPSYRKLNVYQINNSKIKSNILSKKIQQQRQKANIAPFVQVSTSRSYFENKNDHAIVGGLNIGWTPSSPETRKQHEIYDLRRNYLPINQKLDERRFQNQINNIVATLKANKNLLKIILINLRSNNQLISYFDAQAGIQKINSINYSNTYIQKADLLSSLFDIIASSEKNAFVLKVLKNNKILLK